MKNLNKHLERASDDCMTDFQPYGTLIKEYVGEVKILKQSYSEDLDFRTLSSILKKVRVCLLPVEFILGHLYGDYPPNLFTLGASKVTKYEEMLECIEQSGGKKPAEILAEDSKDLTIRLTQHSTVLDLAGCYQTCVAMLFCAALHAGNCVEFNPKHHSSTDFEGSNITYTETAGGVSDTANPYSFDKIIGSHSYGNLFLGNISWPAVPSFGSLQEVNLEQCCRTNQKHLVYWLSSACPNLKILNLSHCPQVQLDILAQLGKACKSIESLDLSLDVKDMSFQATTIAQERLQRSSLRFITTFNASLTEECSLIHLTNLSVQGRSSLTDQELKLVAECCPKISAINLGGCSTLTDAGISVFLDLCQMITSLKASHTTFGSKSLNALVPGSVVHCSSLVSSETRSWIPCEQSNLSGRQKCFLSTLDLKGCLDLDEVSLARLLGLASFLMSLSLANTRVSDDAISSFKGTLLQQLDLSETQVSGEVLTRIIKRNPSLKFLNIRGCRKFCIDDCYTLLATNYDPYVGANKALNIFEELGRNCALDELVVGWGFSDSSMEASRPALYNLKTLSVGMGGAFSEVSLLNLPKHCPCLEHLMLTFQVVSDDGLVHILKSYPMLRTLNLQNCLSQLSSRFISTIASGYGSNITSLKFDRAVPWMKNIDLVTLTERCRSLSHFSLIGCKYLTANSLELIASSWRGLIELQLEECGSITGEGATCLSKCKALQRLLLRHNGSGLHRNFAVWTALNLPLLRSLSLDLCDSVDKGFDSPALDERKMLNSFKLARCRVLRNAFRSVSKPDIKDWIYKCHKETILFEWDDMRHFTTIVSERL